MPFIIEVKTGENESVSFLAKPGREIDEATTYIDRGFSARVEHLSAKAYKERKEKLLLDTIFDGEQLPW